VNLLQLHNSLHSLLETNPNIMKKPILIFAHALCSICFSAQEIDCENICVENIQINDGTGFLEVTINNGSDDFINYPIIIVEVDDEIVANPDSTFKLFGQMAGTTVTHNVTTTLTEIPPGFACTVYLIDGFWDVGCTLYYPCIPDGVAATDESAIHVFYDFLNDCVVVQSEIEFAEIELLNSFGQVIQSKENPVTSCPVNLAGLSSGVYFLRMKSENGIAACHSFIR